MVKKQRTCLRHAAFGIVVEGGGPIAEDTRVVYVIKKKSVHSDPRPKLPGGGCELGESPRDTLVREIEEELGLIVEAKDLKRVTESTIRNRDGSIFRLFFYAVPVLSFRDMKMDTGEDEYVRTTTIGALLRHTTMLPKHREAVEEFTWLAAT